MKLKEAGMAEARATRGAIGLKAAWLCCALGMALSSTFPAAATQPARRDFVLDWPAVRSAAQGFDRSDAARFEARYEELSRQRPYLILTPPAPYFVVGRGGGDHFFLEAVVEMFTSALRKSQTARVGCAPRRRGARRQMKAIRNTS